MNKSALIERLVRLGATDVPGTPRLLMKQRSPQELAALQQGVTDAFQRFEEPAKKAVHGILDKVPHEKAKSVLKRGASTLIENPEMLPISALPIPGASVAYLAGKKGLERGLDRIAPLPKLAFSTNAFSGPMNPVIESGASFQPGFKVPSLKAPVQQKIATKEEKQRFSDLQRAELAGGGLLALNALHAPEAAQDLVGAVRFHHGTRAHAAENILRSGLDPSLGGLPSSGGAISTHTPEARAAAFDNNPLLKITTSPKQLEKSHREFAERAKGHSFVTTLAQDAEDYAALKPDGKVVSGTLPFEDFHSRFVPDIDHDPFTAFKTKQKIAPEVFHTTVGDIAAQRLKNPKGYTQYLRNNPGRVARGAGKILAPIAGAGLIYHALKKKNQPEEKTAEEFKLQGHTTHQGLGIAIENRKGSVRKGVDKDGKPWRTKMIHPYGYIKGTKGADGEEVDCYVGPVADATHAHVVHQKKEDGSYDEDKVMLGFASEEDARKAYLAHYNTDRFLGPIKSVPMTRFKQMAESGKKLVKIGASAPTRGNFMMASDIPSFKAPSLRAPVEKTSDMLPDYVPSDEGASFKRSKFAAALESLKASGKIRIFNGDHYQSLLDKKKEDPVDRGEIVAEDALPATKEAESAEDKAATKRLAKRVADQIRHAAGLSKCEEKCADISPTQPLGNGGGNPHRMQSWLASPRVNSLAAPLNKVAEPMGDFAAAYWGGPGAAGRGPVSEAGFRQASDQNGPPSNSLRAPLRKLGSLVPGSATAAKSVGTKPMFSGGPGQSIADIAKPKGLKFGGPLPGANKTTIGGYVPPSLK